MKPNGDSSLFRNHDKLQIWKKMINFAVITVPADDHAPSCHLLAQWWLSEAMCL